MSRKPRKASPPVTEAPASDAPRAERIAKLLARAGVASRRAAEAMIAEGRVALKGKPVESPALKLESLEGVTVDGKPVAAPEPPRLWLYHKPVGLITTERDAEGRPTVFASLPPEMPRVVSVGRLDINSEGLLLLTNDGAIKRRLELPETGWTRKYRVRFHGKAEEATFEPLRKGLEIEGERFRPMVVTLDRVQGANGWATVAITEGRNREIRRAFEAIGLKVNRLIRVSYGPFQLGTLEPGAVREVPPRVLADQLGLPRAAAEKSAGGETRTTPGPGKAGKGGARKRVATKGTPGAGETAPGPRSKRAVQVEAGKPRRPKPRRGPPSRG